MQLVVGRVGRAHGVQGFVTLDVRTSDPDVRFAVGEVLSTDPADAGPLTVEASRWHSGRLLVRFSRTTNRTTAEELRGVALVVDSDALPDLDDPDDFYDHDLVGLSARLTDGEVLGTVSDVLHLPGGDMLSVTRIGGGEVLVPFVREFVPEVDPAQGMLVVTPPPGLLDLADG